MDSLKGIIRFPGYPGIGSSSTMTITGHHQNNITKDIVLHGIRIGGKCYVDLLIITDLHCYDPHANIQNSMQYALLYYSEYAILSNK